MRKQPTGRNRGAIIIVTILVVFTLSSLVLVMCSTMRVESMSSSYLSSSLQASSIERGAEQYVIGLLTEQKSSLSTFTDDYFAQVQVGDGYFWLLRPNYGDPDQSPFGLTEESAKLNINVATSEALGRLPYMTDDVSLAIIDWRGGAGGGSQDSYYSGLNYRSKKGAFETVEEVLLVQGASRQLLYGDGTVDPLGMVPSLGRGNAGGQAAMDLARAHGIYDLLTVYSSEAAAATAQKVNLADRNQRSQLQQVLETKLDKSRAAQIVTLMGRDGYTDVFDFAFAMKLTSDEFTKIYDSITAGPVAAPAGRGGGAAGGTPAPAQPVKGLININTAPRDVLYCIPGLETGDVDDLIAKRRSLGTTPPTNPAWIIDVLDQKKCHGLASKITSKTGQYSADILAVSGDGKAFKRVRIVVEASGSTPQIIYRRDLTDRGWPMPQQVLTSLRSGQGLTAMTRMSGGMTK